MLDNELATRGQSINQKPFFSPSFISHYIQNPFHHPHLQTLHNHNTKSRIHPSLPSSLTPEICLITIVVTKGPYSRTHTGEPSGRSQCALTPFNLKNPNTSGKTEHRFISATKQATRAMNASEDERERWGRCSRNNKAVLRVRLVQPYE